MTFHTRSVFGLERRADESPFAYWISFWPTAPFFGVEWRFAGMLAPMAGFFDPLGVAMQMTRASADEAAVAAEETVEDARSAVRKVGEKGREVAERASLVTTAGGKAAGDAVEPAMEGSAEGAVKPSGLLKAPPANADDLKTLKGVGPKLEKMLNAMGVYTFAQIAAFSEANLRWIDANLTTFNGRPFRDDWIAQARALVA